jgi:hypothetical protein
MKVSKGCLRRNASCIIFLWARLVFPLNVCVCEPPEDGR